MKKITTLLVLLTFFGSSIIFTSKSLAVDLKGFVEFKPENKEVKQSLIDDPDSDATIVISDAQTKNNGEPKIKKIRRIPVNGEFRDAGEGLFDGIIATQRAKEPRYNFTVEFDPADFTATCAGANKREDFIIDSDANQIIINRSGTEVIFPVGPISIKVKSRITNNGQKFCQFTVTGDFAKGVEFGEETTLIDQLGSFLLKTSRRAIQVANGGGDEPPDDGDPPGNGGDGNDGQQLPGELVEDPNLGGLITISLQGNIPEQAQEFMDDLGAEVEYEQVESDSFVTNDSAEQFISKFVQKKEEGDDTPAKELRPYLNILEILNIISANPEEATAFLNGLGDNFLNLNEAGTAADEPTVQAVVVDNQTTTAEYVGAGSSPNQGIFAISTSGTLIFLDQADPTGNSDSVIGTASTQNFRVGVKVCPDGQFFDPETKTCLEFIDDDQGSGGLASDRDNEIRQPSKTCPRGQFPSGFDDNGFVTGCIACNFADEPLPDECQ